jgi:hypothetical protein
VLAEVGVGSGCARDVPVDSLEVAQGSCWDIAYLLKLVACHNSIMECLPALFKFCETAFEFGRIDPFDIVNELC